MYGVEYGQGFLSLLYILYITVTSTNAVWVLSLQSPLVVEKYTSCHPVILEGFLTLLYINNYSHSLKKMHVLWVNNI